MENDPTILDVLLETESWQTLATFARESARTSSYTFFIALHESIVIALIYFSYTTAQRPTLPAPDAPSTRIMDDDIPPELFDEVATPAHGNGRPSANVRVCPHCTFENTNSGNDCDLCGLPL
jgi:nuclear protein localization family protein 4